MSHRLIIELRQSGVLVNVEAERADRLRRLRNEVAHESGQTITARAAETYVSNAMQLRASVKAKLDTEAPSAPSGSATKSDEGSDTA